MTQSIALPRHHFGRTGFSVSTLGFGAAPNAYLKTESDAAAELVNRLLDAGINLIDTAVSYPGSEEFLGNHLSKRRKDFFLVSKCGGKDREFGEPAWSSELIKKQVDRSLKLLQTDHIDAMLLHTCDLAKLQEGEALGALKHARDAGKIRFVGYSGDNEAAAFAVMSGDVSVIETSINIVDQRNIDHVLPLTIQENVGVIAKRPIANACWRNASEQRGIYQNYVKTYADRFRKMNVTPQDLGFGGVDDWPEIALRFTLSFAGVGTAIVGTTNEKNALHNLDIARKGPLSADAVTRLRDAFTQADPDGTWTGQT